MPKKCQNKCQKGWYTSLYLAVECRGFALHDGGVTNQGPELWRDLPGSRMSRVRPPWLRYHESGTGTPVTLLAASLPPQQLSAWLYTAPCRTCCTPSPWTSPCLLGKLPGYTRCWWSLSSWSGTDKGQGVITGQGHNMTKEKGHDVIKGKKVTIDKGEGHGVIKSHGHYMTKDKGQGVIEGHGHITKTWERVIIIYRNNLEHLGVW